MFDKILVSIVFLAGSVPAACDGVMSWNGGASGCICLSGEDYTSGTCIANPTCVDPHPIQTVSNTTLTTSGMTLSTINMNGTTSSVSLVLSLPAMATRNYTNIWIAGAALEPTVGCDYTLFTSSVQSTDSSLCTDTFTLAIPFTSLTGCGFSPSTTTAPVGFQMFDGTLQLHFTENTTIGTGDFQSAVQRSASIDFPFRIKFVSQYTVNLTSSVYVFSKQQIDFAITSQTIPKDGSSPTLVFASTSQYPYTVTAYSVVTSTAPITAAVDNRASPQQCVSSDYMASTNATASTCTILTNSITFTSAHNNASACAFNHYEYTIPFDVFCPGFVTDCPLASADTSGSAQFTISSENFCVNQTYANTINDVIAISSYYSALSSITSGYPRTASAAFRVGDNMQYCMIFTGLPLNSVSTHTLSSDFGSTLTGTYTPVVTTSANFDDTSTGMGLNDTNYCFVVTCNSELLHYDTATIIRGAKYLLKLQSVIDVTYTAAVGRRREAVTSTVSGSGTKESSMTTIIPAEAATTPKSAGVHAAPCLYVAMALMSAIVIA